MPLLSILGITGGLGGGGGGFDPNNDLTMTTRGVILDCWDETSHFLGIPGTIAAAASTTGEEVGLVMSKDEFSTNDTAANLIDGVTDAIATPDLSSSTGWTTSDGGVVIGSGVAAFDGAADNQSLTEAGAIAVDDDWYLIQIVLSAYTSGSFRLRVGEGGGAETAYFTPSGAGTYNCWIKSDTNGGASPDFVFEGNVSPNRFIGSVDTLSAKNVPGSHFYADASNRRPTRQQDGSSVWHISGDGSERLTTDAGLSWATDRTITIMAKADVGSQDRYDGFFAVNGGAGSVQWTFGNTNNGTWQQGLYRPFITNVWNSASDETGVNIWDIRDNESTNQMSVRKNTVSALSLTSHSGTDTASSCAYRLFTASNFGEMAEADIYGVYVYEDAESDDLYTWLDDNTGNQT